MPLVNEPKWEIHKITDPGTPYGIGFAQGETVYVGNDEGALPGLDRYYPIVFNGQQIRYVTPAQLEGQLQPIRALTAPERADATRRFLKLEKDIARTPNGIVWPQGQPIWPPDLARPAWLPATYLGLKVHLVDWAPAVRSGFWMADWWAGQHIYFLRRWIVKVYPRYPDQIPLTLRHEFTEQGISLTLARVIFPRATERQWEGLAQQFGGYAHSVTVHITDGEVGESWYNIKLELMNKTVGFGPQAS